MTRFALIVLATLGVTACGGRHQVVVAPVKVEPIHMTIDVNLRDDTTDDEPKTAREKRPTRRPAARPAVPTQLESPTRLTRAWSRWSPAGQLPARR